MTKLGKFLVFLNLGISLSLMIWAISSFTNRIDWSDNKERKKEDGSVIPEGELVKRLARAKQVWNALPTAEAEWRAPRKDLEIWEERRRATRRWYEAELAKLDFDKNVNAPTPLKRIPDGAAQPDEDPAANPDPGSKNAMRLKMEDAKDQAGLPLLARNIYEEQKRKLFYDDPTGLLVQRTRHRTEVEKHIELLNRMTGPNPKGLHVRLQEEMAKRDGLTGEIKIIDPLLVNTAVSSLFAIDRQAELGKRVAELEAERNELRRKLGVAGEAPPK